MKYIFKNAETKRSAIVTYCENAIIQEKWSVELWSYGSPDFEARGTYGTGVRTYMTEKQAVRAAKNYIK